MLFYTQLKSVSTPQNESQKLARPGFQVCDRDCPNPSLNIETKTMNPEVSVLSL